MSQNVGVDANKLIDLAAKQLMAVGQGQTMSGTNKQDCFDILNMMLGEWSEQRAAIYRLIDITFPCDGSLSYTIGAGGKINSINPIRLESAYTTNNGSNNDLTVVHAKEDWNRIVLPSLSSFPTQIFLDTNWPLGLIKIWPVPNNAYTVTITAISPLTQFQQLTDVVSLRPAYQLALVMNLSVRIAPLFGMEPSATVMRGAVTSKRTIEKANTQIPVLQVDVRALRHSRYNPFSDTST